MSYLKYVLISVLVTFSLFTLKSQSETRMEFFPASEDYLPLINVYSNSGAIKQYYIKDGAWILNENVGSPNITIKGDDYRFQYKPEAKDSKAGLFVYSTQSGEFQFFYLDGEEWQENPYLVKGKVILDSKNIRMNYSRGNSNNAAFISAYTVDGNQMSVLQYGDDGWAHLEYFPKVVK